ncbi:Uma2 family endonuclease [Calothrix rhizosoleniae]|uniref:Uma2 family endonuclease n=1 Tax=Calothrix rhizosoleniae TaxID=888997 RepID=UPI000B49DC9C|nr:Uma2 family endonuclease [Calothrix rhizosoleniae]
MVLLQDFFEILQAEDPEERQIISGVSWESYETLLNELGNSLQYRVTYLDGVLEFVSPSRKHERNKTNIGSLVEAYCQEKRIRYFPLGSMTLRQQKIKGGTEPDESYCIGIEKELPDIAIEVVVTSGGLDKLEVYKRLGVNEVWYFKNNQLDVYCLGGNSYEQVEKSEILPNLDLKMLAEYVVAIDPLEAALECRERVRGMEG